jgi:hypothetical protein
MSRTNFMQDTTLDTICNVADGVYQIGSEQEEHDSSPNAAYAPGATIHRTFVFETEAGIFVYGLAGGVTLELTQQLQRELKKPIHTIISQGGQQNVSIALLELKIEY